MRPCRQNRGLITYKGGGGDFIKRWEGNNDEKWMCNEKEKMLMRKPSLGRLKARPAPSRIFGNLRDDKKSLKAWVKKGGGSPHAVPPRGVSSRGAPRFSRGTKKGFPRCGAWGNRILFGARGFGHPPALEHLEGLPQLWSLPFFLVSKHLAG